MTRTKDWMGDEVELMMVWIQTRWRFGSPARQHYGNDTWLQRIAMMPQLNLMSPLNTTRLQRLLGFGETQGQGGGWRG